MVNTVYCDYSYDTIKKVLRNEWIQDKKLEANKRLFYFQNASHLLFRLVLTHFFSILYIIDDYSIDRRIQLDDI